MRIFTTAVIIVALVIIGAIVFVWSGVYNVAASEPHYAFTIWFLDEVRERSVEVHSEGIRVSSYSDPKYMNIGVRHYDAVCRVCHGAPGYPLSEIAQGLNPEPPTLTSRDVQENADAQLYWIIENGIKMTGMPAFGKTHQEEELLGILAFLRRLSTVKHEDYGAMLEAAGRHQ